jgi:TRAP-type C4-dicarboxylate transport system substrate-binding protein
VSSPNHRWNAYWTLINKDKWQALPRNLQEAMAKNVDDGVLAERQDVINRERGIVANLESKGIQCNSPEQASFKAKLRANGYFARAKAEFDPAVWAALQKYSDLP